jgi:hypothetical protein
MTIYPETANRQIGDAANFSRAKRALECGDLTPLFTLTLQRFNTSAI